jgi:hypothetical protein
MSLTQCKCGRWHYTISKDYPCHYCVIEKHKKNEKEKNKKTKRITKGQNAPSNRSA